MKPGRRWAFGALLTAACLLAGCAQSTEHRLEEGVAEEITEQPFYALPDPIPAGNPGDVVRTEELRSAPYGTVAWRVMYHSTDVHGAPLLASAVVIAPTAPWTGGGPRPVVAWGHPTTGMAARCAPSTGVDPFDLIEGMTNLLDAGYAVVAADYPGMGVAGPDSYLVGATEANSVLDAVRASRQLAPTGVTTLSDVLLWGHSQGGHAVLFAAQQAPSYAPDLRLTAAAVAAPATELGTLLDDDIGDVSGVSLGSYAFQTYQSVYGSTIPGLALTQVLTDDGAAATPQMADLCLIGQNRELHDIAGPLVGKYLSNDPATTEPWAGILQQNTPGNAPITVPLFVAQGLADQLVHPAATEQFVTQQCGKGTHVVFKEVPGAGHGQIALDVVPDVLAFFAAARAGTPTPSTC
ncbi:alpha/beta fold hydrolase [Nakamurella sp.]|uniref:alpha/beta fold hydrolase n=1 Tax=Nakamurella sp. TaxID=1869182 RepID=UPI003783D826